MTRRMVTNPLPRANHPAVIAAFMDHIESDDPARFKVGDGLIFQKRSGQIWPLMILGIHGEDVEAICYDGMPHLVPLTMSDLEKLRVVKIEENGVETVDMYRRLVGLDVEEIA